MGLSGSRATRRGPRLRRARKPLRELARIGPLPGPLALLLLLVVLAVPLASGCGDRGADFRRTPPTVEDDALVARLNAGLVIEKRRLSRRADGRRAHISLRWRNETRQTAFRALALQCIALRGDGAMLAIGSADFFDEPGRRPIRPGFVGRLEVVLDVGPDPPAAISCSVSEAR